MVYRYKDAIKKYGSDYQIKKAIQKGELTKLDKSLYIDKEAYDYLELMEKKYPRGIISGDSAYYYHDLTDHIPNKISLTTGRNDTKIHNHNIKQVFSKEEFLNLGVTTMEIDGVLLKIYDKERMLCELMKHRKTMPFDYYKEIVNNYKEIADELDYEKLGNYLEKYKNHSELYDAMLREVF